MMFALRLLLLLLRSALRFPPLQTGSTISGCYASPPPRAARFPLPVLPPCVVRVFSVYRASNDSSFALLLLLPVLIFSVAALYALFRFTVPLAGKRKRLRSLRHLIRFVFERQPPLRFQPDGHHADAEEDAVVPAQAAPSIAHAFP